MITGLFYLLNLFASINIYLYLYSTFKNQLIKMKTVDGYKAQFIIEDLLVKRDSILYHFQTTGEIINNRVAEYHAEIDHMIMTPHMFTKKTRNNIIMLKKYFNHYAPLPVHRERSASSIKKMMFANKTYAGEHTEFQITWSELIINLIQPDQVLTPFSISLEDAKVLAKQILNY